MQFPAETLEAKQIHANTEPKPRFLTKPNPQWLRTENCG